MTEREILELILNKLTSIETNIKELKKGQSQLPLDKVNKHERLIKLLDRSYPVLYERVIDLEETVEQIKLHLSIYDRVSNLEKSIRQINEHLDKVK